MKNKDCTKTLKSIGNPSGPILFVVEEICDFNLYQDFHNKIYHRNSNTKILFEKDFLIINFEKLAEDRNIFLNFDVVIFVGGNKVELLNIQKTFNPLKGKLFEETKYLRFTDSKKNSILFFITKLQDFNRDVLSAISSDITSFLVYDESIINLRESLKKEIIYYQYNCEKCDEYNLFILNRNEPTPLICQKCNDLASCTNGELPDNTLVLTNGELKQIQ